VNRKKIPVYGKAEKTNAKGESQRIGGGDGDVSAIPLATAWDAHFFGLGVGQSTVMRVPAVVPVTSNIGVPVPKTLVGPKSLK